MIWTVTYHSNVRMGKTSSLRGESVDIMIVIAHLIVGICLLWLIAVIVLLLREAGPDKIKEGLKTFFTLVAIASILWAIGTLLEYYR